VFALGLGMTSHQGPVAVGISRHRPYALCALVAYGLHRLKLPAHVDGSNRLGRARVTWHRCDSARLEARWRVAQPEVGVIQRAGDNLSKDRNLYPSYDKHGKLINPIPGLRPTSPSFPYFPLMGVFGLPSAETHKARA